MAVLRVADTLSVPRNLFKICHLSVTSLIKPPEFKMQNVQSNYNMLLKRHVMKIINARH